MLDIVDPVITRGPSDLWTGLPAPGDDNNWPWQAGPENPGSITRVIILMGEASASQRAEVASFVASRDFGRAGAELENGKKQRKIGKNVQATSQPAKGVAAPQPTTRPSLTAGDTIGTHAYGQSSGSSGSR